MAAAWPSASSEALQIIQKLANYKATTPAVKPNWIGKFVDVLTDKLNERISFQIGSMVVNATWLQSAAEAYSQKLVPIFYDPDNVLAQLKVRVSALYLSGMRALLTMTEYIDDKFEKGMIVHESVHLALNRRGQQGVLKTENEVIAHLAQAMYYHLHEWDRVDVFTQVIGNKGYPLLNKEPIEKAWDVAEFLLGQPPNKAKGEKQWTEGKTPGDDPKQYHQLVEALRSAIKSAPAYIPDIGKVINYTSF